MTAEAQVSKNYYRLNGGLNTENNEIGFPEGYTTDEANYELLVDGSRRRRKGLAEETGGVPYTTSAITAGDFNQTYLWRNVGSDPTLDVIVFREGEFLHFAESSETVSSGWATGKSINMNDFRTTGASTATFDFKAISFAQGRGRLLVSGQYLKPFYVDFDGTDYTATPIDVKIRDFTTIDEGVTNDNEPTTLSADHEYNLRNRGWTPDLVTVFQTDLSKYPAMNALWFKGFKRVFDGSTASAQIADFDGARVWDSAKMDAEVFGNSSAPRGSLFLSPFDTTVGYAPGGSELIDISTWTVADTGADPWVVTITTASAHGLVATNSVGISNNLFYYASLTGTDAYGSLDGVYTCQAGTTGSTIVINVPGLVGFSSWNSQYLNKGVVDVSPLTRSTGTAHNDSFRAVAWHAGRAFYGGMANSEFADSVFYSQVVDAPEKYGKCYQDADPTDEYFNAIVPTDGGELIIPGMGGIIEMISTRSSLLVLGLDGVWEINGGRDGFTADTFNVRKLTDEGCSSSTSVVKIEGAIIYTGPGGIFIIAPNQYTGILEVQNAILDTIQTKWNSITTTEQERCQAFYDDAQKRAYFLVKTSHADSTATGSAYDEMLVFDSKIAAWYRYTFSANGLLAGFAIPTADDPATNKKAKFIYAVPGSGFNVEIADFAQTTFDDWDGNNGPIPYMYTGWDQSAPYQSRRQAPLVTVHSKRTETGYVDNGTGWDPTNTSSTLMTAYWDWTDDAVTNKIGANQEVYRHVRDFVPAAADDVNGYPVVTTRNKVRGRGRALQLKFQGATDKDSHILGYTVNYKVSRRK